MKTIIISTPSKFHWIQVGDEVRYKETWPDRIEYHTGIVTATACRGGLKSDGTLALDDDYLIVNNERENDVKVNYNNIIFFVEPERWFK